MAGLRIPETFGPSDAAPWIERWSRVRDAKELAIELASASFAQPAGVALLAAGIADRRERGLATSMSTDRRDAGPWQYLQSIDFFRELDVARTEDSARHREEDRAVPLRPIATLEIARTQAELAVRCIEKQLPELSPSPIRMARFVFEELGANIVQHSGRASTGFGVAKAFPKLRRLQIAFADAGVGFSSSLSRNPEFAGRIADDSEALQLALSPHVSGVGNRATNMGFGLKLLMDFADRLSGDLWLASGTSILHRRTVAGNQRANLVRSIAPWRGSFVCLDAPLPQPA